MGEFEKDLFDKRSFFIALNTSLTLPDNSPGNNRSYRLKKKTHPQLHSSTMASSQFYKLSALRGDGKMQKMSEFVGKVVYATNVASK